MNHLAGRRLTAGAGAKASIDDRHQEQTRHARNSAIGKGFAENFRDVSPLIGYDIKSTLQVLLEMGVTDLPAVGHDVLIGAFLLNSLRREQTLSELAQSDLGYDGSPFENLDHEEVMSRAPEIIAVIKALAKQQTKELKAIPKLPKLAADVEWPVIPVLEEPWHLSYPFLIEHDDELWMIPESSGNRDVALYKCVGFPNKWERHATLLSGLELADATITRHNGMHYLFGAWRDGTARVQAPGRSSIFLHRRDQ